MNNQRLLRIGAWSGLAWLMLFGTGWFNLAHFLPPLAPTMPAIEVAQLFQEHHARLMLASLFMMCSTWPLLPFSALLLLVTRKIEDGVGMLTLMIGFSCLTYMVMNFFFSFSFAMAAYRPERSPELVQYATDYGNLLFMGGLPMFMAIWVVGAYAVLVASPRVNPVLPRWFGYLNLWAALLTLPELLVFFFRTGPFAWDGLLGFWIPAVVAVAYFVLTPVAMLRAVRTHFA